MFVSGRDALSSIEDGISTVRSNETQVASVLRSAMDEAERQRQTLAQTYRALALVRLDAVMRGDIVGELDAAERRAVDLMRAQKAKLDQLLIRHAGATQKVRDAETAHRAATEAVEKAGAPIATLTAEVGKKLEDDTTWQAQHVRVETMTQVAQGADDKAKQAEADRDTKRKPYEADPLFMYLWKRGFGTASYSAGNFVRMMDRWVARLVGYDTARPNYVMLNEIPVRLRENAAAREKDLEHEHEALAAIERKALEDAGVKPLEQELAKARTALDGASKTLNDAQTALAALDKERAQLIEQGDRQAHEEAISVLSQALERDDIQTLYKDALATKTGDDDKLVQKIDETQRAIAKADAEVSRIRDEAREIARRRGELEGVRDNFRRRQYDQPWGGFELDRGNVMGDMIGGIVRGAIRGAVLWSILEGGYRRRDYGGRGWPGSSVPPLRLPSSSIPRMGGFGTRGGFGGGGFRTRGRF
ncbi:MAG: hypothetical protein GC190_10280 [Alphaproteobacteria bacterium]|nr:hypothetical protein [Alphaproteobacteria bacterium]